jgi:hypothetical protein
MEKFVIEDHRSGCVVKSSNGEERYNIRQDMSEGDWAITKHGSASTDFWYTETKNGAVKFSLGRLGIIDDPDCEQTRAE